MLAMDVNENAGSPILSGVLETIAGMLAPGIRDLFGEPREGVQTGLRLPEITKPSENRALLYRPHTVQAEAFSTLRAVLIASAFSSTSR